MNKMSVTLKTSRAIKQGSKDNQGINTMKALTKINCRNCHYSFYQDIKETKDSDMHLAHKEGYKDKKVLFSAYTNEYAECPVCKGILATD